MKTNTLFILLVMMMTTISCSGPVSENPEKWRDKELSTWFQSGKWESGWNVMPDESIDQREFAIQYYKNKERWDKAFRFLATHDLKSIELGKYKLEGDSLFANIQEYTTKNEEDTRFEAHRKYADIQYIIDGEEKIGVTNIANATETVPYDDSKDIMFLSSEQSNYRLASPEKFFIFFPDNAHRPCFKANENMKVRKAVIKVLIN